MGSERRLMLLGKREELKGRQEQLFEDTKTQRKAISNACFISDDPMEIDADNILANAKTLAHKVEEYREMDKKIKEIKEELGG